MDGNTFREVYRFNGCNFHMGTSELLQYLVRSRYGKRADPGPDVLDADGPARIRSCLGGDEARRRHTGTAGTRYAESARARGLAGHGDSAFGDVAICRWIHRLGQAG